MIIVKVNCWRNHKLILMIHIPNNSLPDNNYYAKPTIIGQMLMLTIAA